MKNCVCSGGGGEGGGGGGWRGVYNFQFVRHSNFIFAQYIVYLENELLELLNFAYALALPKYTFGLLRVNIFSQIYNRVTALGCCLNFITAQFLLNELTELDKILHMH